MPLRRLPEKICDFLRQRPERMYCDSCIQGRLGLKWRQQVQLITATLAVTEAFEREFNTCCTCNTVKSVTHAVGRAPQAAADPLRTDVLRATHNASLGDPAAPCLLQKPDPAAATVSRLVLPASSAEKQKRSRSV